LKEKNPAGTELWTLSLGFQFGVVGFGSGLLSRKNLLNQDMHVPADTHRINSEEMMTILINRNRVYHFEMYVNLLFALF